MIPRPDGHAALLEAASRLARHWWLEGDYEPEAIALERDLGRPLTPDEARSAIGLFRPSARWAQASLVVVKNRAPRGAAIPGLEPGAGFQVHKDIAGLLHDTFLAAHAAAPGYVVRARDSGGYSPRFSRADQVLSAHASGFAVDINWTTNPMRAPAVTDMPAAWVKAWTDRGWVHGGTFRIPDTMHFVYATGV